jgi:dienelactone hydrolase
VVRFPVLAVSLSVCFLVVSLGCSDGPDEGPYVPDNGWNNRDLGTNPPDTTDVQPDTYRDATDTSDDAEEDYGGWIPPPLPDYGHDDQTEPDGVTDDIDATTDDTNTTPADNFCRSFADCLADEVCVFSTGECEKRGTWTEATPALYGVHPTEVAAGDVIVVDGCRLMAGGLFPKQPTARIGSVNASGVSADENRLIFRITNGQIGPLSVSVYIDNAYKGYTYPVPITAAPKGIIQCSDKTPMASMVPGDRPDISGPYAAGYVDLAGRDDLRTRLYYPAQCGSIRRPPIQQDAPFPLVAILHGNGAIHLQYEYLAELLATWGFVSFMPETQQNMAGGDFQEMLEELMPVIAKLRGRFLDDVHEVLAGVQTTPEIAFIGHSRGTGRAQEAIGADADLKAHAVGFIFLGPVDDGDTVPGQFMVFGGDLDSQSPPLVFNKVYKQQGPPRYKIVLPGGNHGSFCDHKVYGYLGTLAGDKKPTIPRSLQLQITQRFSLPLLQRAFGMDEPFADVLDNAPGTSDFTITRDP